MVPGRKHCSEHFHDFQKRTRTCKYNTHTMNACANSKYNMHPSTLALYYKLLLFPHASHCYLAKVAGEQSLSSWPDNAVVGAFCVQWEIPLPLQWWRGTGETHSAWPRLFLGRGESRTALAANLGRNLTARVRAQSCTSSNRSQLTGHGSVAIADWERRPKN